MKLPKNFNKMNLAEQENWLVKKHRELVAEDSQITKLLAKVRGGQAIYISEEITRPDEAMMKHV